MRIAKTSLMLVFSVSFLGAIYTAPASAQMKNARELDGKSTSHGGPNDYGQTCEDGQWRGEPQFSSSGGPAFAPSGGPGGGVVITPNPCDNPEFQCEQM